MLYEAFGIQAGNTRLGQLPHMAHLNSAKKIWLRHQAGTQALCHGNL